MNLGARIIICRNGCMLELPCLCNAFVIANNNELCVCVCAASVFMCMYVCIPHEGGMCLVLASSRVRIIVNANLRVTLCTPVFTKTTVAKEKHTKQRVVARK